MQSSLSNQKNHEASLRNLETRVGQLAKQLAEEQGGQFSANTQTKLKEQCKPITIQSGKKVGSDVNKETATERDDNRRKEGVEIEGEVAVDSEHAVVEGSSLDGYKSNLDTGGIPTKEKDAV